MANDITFVRNTPTLDGLEKRLMREYRVAFERIGKKGVGTVRRNFDSFAANASGQTRESITAVIGEAGGSFSAKIQASGNRAEVIQFIENGRGPGKMPPIDVILEWMGEVGLTVGEYKVDRDVAFLIARQIGRYGTKGHHIFDKSRGEVARTAREEIEKATRRALRR